MDTPCKTDHPERIYHASKTIYSIARYYGACIIQGKRYIYNPVDDVLIRDDVLKAEAKRIKQDAKDRKKAAYLATKSLF